jgi:hypothetical protein
MKTWNDLKRDFDRSELPQKGVKLPRKDSQKGQTLLYLYQNMGKVVSKPEAEKVICERLGLPTKDIQSLRHLGKQDGFNILQGNAVDGDYTLKRGEYMLRDLEKVNRYYRMSRRDDSNLDWSSIKTRYDNQCATCGAGENTRHRYTGGTVRLEKGHMDPRLPMESSNIIPQCSDCNQRYKDNFIFGLTGCISKPTVEGVIKLLTLQEQEELLSRLRESKNE